MKPRVAFFSLTSCEGCQLVVLEQEDKLLDLFRTVDVVSFREAMSEHSEEYDIAFVEGSVSTHHDLDEVLRIRDRAKFLVALGACATTGGVNAIKNRYGITEVKRRVYGGQGELFDTIAARPVHAVVPVDAFLHGCPIDGEEFLRAVTCFVSGKRFRPPNYPVCVECRLKENVCLFEKGQVCMGPIVRAGCGAICPTYGEPCEGCRGYVDDPQRDAHAFVLKKYGLSVDELVRRHTRFNAYFEESPTGG